MKRKVLIFIVFLLFAIGIVSNSAFAKIIGTVISPQGKYITFDIYAQKKIKEDMLTGIGVIIERPGNVVIDQMHNLLFVIDSKRGFQRIFVYNLKTLEFLKKLDIESYYDEEENSVKILVSSAKSVFYIKWWDETLNNGDGGQVISSYDTSTLNKMSDYTGMVTTEKLLFSKDGTKIYSCSDEDTSPRIDAFDSSNLEKIQTISLKDFIFPGIFAWAITDYKSDLIQITENDKKNDVDKDSYTLFTIDINSLTASKRMRTGIEGTSFLFPSGNKVALDEEKDFSTTSLGKIISVGKVHIYDLINAKKLGEISLEKNPVGWILGVTPDETRLVYYSSPSSGGDAKIFIINLETFSLEGAITVSISPYFIFFSEV